uniref:Uncharacterized protein n=1 Tax=Meloidogyne incognita TaxID=6306 RepID=A0A914KXX3_MELIC
MIELAKLRIENRDNRSNNADFGGRQIELIAAELVIILADVRRCKRVPLLCPCCTQIKSISFHRVTKCASYIMQMQEIALLRSKIEKHLLNHLEINWRIEQLNLNGQVPVGSLLSSVSFLRQMALLTLTIALQIDNQTSPKTSTTTNNDFNVVQVGEIVCVSISIYFSIGAYPLRAFFSCTAPST